MASKRTKSKTASAPSKAFRSYLNALKSLEPKTASPYSKALQAYLEVLQAFEKYARQRMRYAIDNKTANKTASQIAESKRLYHGLTDCRPAALVAGVQAAGHSTLEMDDFLNACQQGCQRFELDLKRYFQEWRGKEEFKQGKAFTDLAILIAGKSGRISRMIAITDSNFLEANKAAEPDKPDRGTDKKNIRLPGNSDVTNLIKRLNNRDRTISKIDVALEFTEGDKKKAENLLRQVNRFPHLLEAHI